MTPNPSAGGYSSYENDYLAGIYAGSIFTFAPSGAAYTSYKTIYDSHNAYLGSDFFYSTSGNNYSSIEYDYSNTGNLEHVKMTGFTGTPYTSLTYNYDGATYLGYEAVYKYAPAVGAYDELDIDVSAQAQVGVTQQTYKFDTVAAGTNYYKYWVIADGAGNSKQEIFFRNDGGVTQLGLNGQTGLTFQSQGNDKITGGAGGESFVFGSTFGHATLTDFANYATSATPDHVTMATSSFTSFADMISKSVNSGSAVLISDSAGNSLQINNMTVATLSNLSAEFSFV